MFGYYFKVAKYEFVRTRAEVEYGIDLQTTRYLRFL